MKKLTFSFLFFLSLLAGLLPGCQKEDITEPPVKPPFTSDPTDTLDPEDPIDLKIIGLIDSTLKNNSLIPQPGIMDEKQLVKEENTQSDTLLCNIKDYEWAPGYGEPLLFDPTADMMWVGNLLRAESITDGSYTPIAAIRKPLVISTSLQNIVGSPSDTMQNPSLSAYREAVAKMFGQGVNGATPANVSFTIEEVRASEEFKMSIGANYGGFWGKVKSNFGWMTQQEKSRFSVVFQQIYYSVDMDSPVSPSDFFLTPPDLTQFGAYSPVYISSIKYGRMALFTFESEKSSEEMKASLDAAFSFFDGEGGSEIETKDQENISSSTIKGFIVGGSGGYAVQAIQGFEGLKKWIVEGGNYSSESPGVPMAYQLRFLKDNSLAKIVLASKFSVRHCEVKYDDYFFTPQAPAEGHYYLCPTLVAGDNEFEGHGPQVDGAVSLKVKNGNELWAVVNMTWRETVPDHTTGKLNKEIHLHTVSADKVIMGIVSEPDVFTSYTDDDFDPDPATLTGGNYIGKMIFIGDTADGDFECNGDLDASVRIFFNKPIHLSVKKI